MSIVTDTWRQLVRRRLWPVALLLVGALAAVPVLLAKDAEPVPAPAPLPGAAAKAQLTVADSEPIVALANADEARRRRVLGARKDPFEAAPVKPGKAAATPVGAGTETIGGAAPVDTFSAGSGGSTGSPVGGSTPPAFSPVAPPLGVAPIEPEKKPTYPLHTLTVRFGVSDGAQERDKLRRLEALPSPDEPVLVYLGVKDGGKVAVFLVDTGVLAQGDGSCKPDPQTCETLHMREGDTEFFDVIDEEGVVGAQYQLDLIDIQTTATSSAAKARKANAAAKGGQKVLKARVAGSGPLRYRYNARKGTVERLDMMTFEAAVTRAGAAIAGAFQPAP